MRIHTIVVISNRTQWSECITEGMLGIPRNNNWTMPGVARPPSLHSQSYHRKYDVFSSLPQPHSVGKPSKQRRDVIRQELKDVGVPEDKRYDIATTSKVTWYTICHISVRELQQSDLTDKPPNQAECRSMSGIKGFIEKKNLKCHFKRGNMWKSGFWLQCWKSYTKF